MDTLVETKIAITIRAGPHKKMKLAPTTKCTCILEAKSAKDKHITAKSEL